jgi:ABC-type multidrug transport system ATPase subunit
MAHGRPAILAEGLEKSYGKTRALQSLDLEVEEGTVLGLLGPNGAGKTTAVRILTTLLRPDAGRAGRRCSLPRSIWRKQTCWRTGSPSSTRGG